MYKQINVLGVKTSKREIRDILKAWSAISFAFALILAGGQPLVNFIIAFLLSGLTVGIGFLFHELAHKFVAQHYGAVAEFRAQSAMLWLMVLLAFIVSVIFAAPGAVVIASRVTTREHGIIAAAGPVTNYVLAAIFFGLNLVLPSIIFTYGFMINSWLGLFNMIPIFVLDGKKVWKWSKPVFLVLLGIGIFLVANTGFF